jgi:unsaturated rhamnogalacturonyl hydrolase
MAVLQFADKGEALMSASLVIHHLKLIILLFISVIFSVSCLISEPEIISPADNGLVYGKTCKLIVKSCSRPDLNVILDGEECAALWLKEAWPFRWMAEIAVPNKGEHELVVKRGASETARIRFNNGLSIDEIAEKVISQYFFDNKPENLKWDWAPAVFLYGLMKYAPFSSNEGRCIDYVSAYHRTWLEKGLPKINWADECPPALSALMLNELYGMEFAMPAVIKVVSYIRTAPRNVLGSINHLGSSPFSLVYPDSIWVDSLMMWALPAVQYSVDANDSGLLEFGLAQPFIFADKLLDNETGLFHHAWNIDAGTLCPKDNAIWLRGNAWVLVSIIEMISTLDKNHPRYPELCGLFRNLADSTLTYRQPSGFWDTVMAEPGYAYEESSGTALIAYAYAKGYRLGLLDESFMAAALDTFSSITARLEKGAGGYSVTGVSSGTIPSNRLGYKLVPTGDNILYGAGAYLMLATEMIISEKQ